MIKDTSPTVEEVRDTSGALPLVGSREVARGLGAQEVLVLPRVAEGPYTLSSLREEVFGRLASKGGRPALRGATLRQKIALRPGDWHVVQRVARELSRDQGKSVSGGQVLSHIVTVVARSLRAQISASHQTDRHGRRAGRSRLTAR